MSQEQFPQPNQPPVNGDFVPQPGQDSPSGTEYMAPEALEALANQPEAEHFADLPNDSKIYLYRTERFNRIVGQKYMPLLQEYIDSPESDIPREAFDTDFSGELSPRGFLLDPEGNETNYRPDSIGRFRVDPEKASEAVDSAYQQFTAEQKMAKAVDEIDESIQEQYDTNPSEVEPESVEDLQQKQAERDKQDEIIISNFKAHGATDEQIESFRNDLSRMKEAELKRGRLFPHQSGFVRFEALSHPDDDLDMGVDSGFEQGEDVQVQRTSGQLERGWTFMGIDKRTGSALVGSFDQQTGERLYKDYQLEELKKLNQRKKK